MHTDQEKQNNMPHEIDFAATNLNLTYVMMKQCEININSSKDRIRDGVYTLRSIEFFKTTIILLHNQLGTIDPDYPS